MAGRMTIAPNEASPGRENEAIRPSFRRKALFDELQLKAILHPVRHVEHFMSSGSDAEVGGGGDLEDHPIQPFSKGSTTFVWCDKFRTMRIGRQKAVDREVLDEIGEGDYAERWIGEETPWRRLFDMAFQRSYREVVVEFISTFTYRPGAVPEIVFSMLRQRHEMSLAEFAFISSLYWEPETVTSLYTAGITEIDDATLRAWWPLIADDPFAGTKARVSRIRDPLIRYMHRLIATSIAGRGRSREWSRCRIYFICTTSSPGVHVSSRAALPSTSRRITIGSSAKPYMAVPISPL
ncbi:hypothetical protein R6Q57_017184 [Mikania cordata]